MLLPPDIGVAVRGGNPKNPKAYVAVWSALTTHFDKVIREAARWCILHLNQQQKNEIQNKKGKSQKMQHPQSVIRRVLLFLCYHLVD